MTYYTHSEAETEALAQRLAPYLDPGTVIAFAQARRPLPGASPGGWGSRSG